MDPIKIQCLIFYKVMLNSSLFFNVNVYRHDLAKANDFYNWGQREKFVFFYEKTEQSQTKGPFKSPLRLVLLCLPMAF